MVNAGMVGVDSSWPELAIAALLTVLIRRGENVVYEARKGHGEAGEKVTADDPMEPRELA
jgi:hypothetical protein